MFLSKARNSLALLAIAGLASGTRLAAADPARAGGRLPGLIPAEISYYNTGKERFLEIDSVQGTEPGAPGVGLGPRFNSNSCVSCHGYPAAGGSSPALNPQIALATQFGAKNTVPSFLDLHGPTREVRFKFNPDGSRDGGVHAIFVIAGRADAARCDIHQPDFAAAAASDNLSFRIPTPVFGAGLIQGIPDSTILANKVTDLAAKQALGISGHENRNGNDGTLTRFGWKAQNVSLAVFAGEAYNVEQGVTNEIFPNERDQTPSCALNATPEDHTNFGDRKRMDAISDTAAFTQFMRFLAPPRIERVTRATQNGSSLFATVGCVHCHTPTMTTSPSTVAALSKQNAQLYSDLLVHHMGPGLADNIIQGAAGPDEFRSAPLWGVGQRLFYLHDGRARDLPQAIQAHASVNLDCRPGQTATSNGIACASEANSVISKYNLLSDSQKNDILEFLGSL